MNKRIDTYGFLQYQHHETHRAAMLKSRLSIPSEEAHSISVSLIQLTEFSVIMPHSCLLLLIIAILPCGKKSKLHTCEYATRPRMRHVCKDIQATSLRISRTMEMWPHFSIPSEP